MKAIAVFPQRREVRLIDHPEPSITQSTQVKLRMLEVGVCGTDKEICSFGFGRTPSGFDYLVLGHEALGEVVDVGSDVRSLKPGDLVVPVVRRPCPHAECRSCRVGRQDFCFTNDYSERGIKEAHGFMTEFIVDDERYMHLVPPALRDVAVLVEPLTIAEKGLTQIWQMQQRLPWRTAEASDDKPGRGMKAVVLGAGPIGQLGAMLLVTAGFETYVYSRSQAPNFKADLVTSIGARYFSTETTSAQQLVEQIGRIDLVYEAAGGPPSSIEILKVLGTNGIYVFTGVPEHPIANFSIQNLVGKNQVVFGTVNAGPDAFSAAIRSLSSFTQQWPDTMRSLITGRYPIEGFHDLMEHSSAGIKNIIELASVTATVR